MNNNDDSKLNIQSMSSDEAELNARLMEAIAKPERVWIMGSIERGQEILGYVAHCPTCLTLALIGVALRVSPDKMDIYSANEQRLWMGLVDKCLTIKQMPEGHGLCSPYPVVLFKNLTEQEKIWVITCVLP